MAGRRYLGLTDQARAACAGYTRHAIMLTSVKYGSIARYRSGPGTPGANVSTATATPAMSVVLASKKYDSQFRQGGTDSVLFRV